MTQAKPPARADLRDELNSSRLGAALRRGFRQPMASARAARGAAPRAPRTRREAAGGGENPSPTDCQQCMTYAAVKGFRGISSPGKTPPGCGIPRSLDARKYRASHTLKIQGWAEHTKPSARPQPIQHLARPWTSAVSPIAMYDEAAGKSVSGAWGGHDLSLLHAPRSRHRPSKQPLRHSAAPGRA